MLRHKINAATLVLTREQFVELKSLAMMDNFGCAPTEYVFENSIKLFKGRNCVFGFTSENGKREYILVLASIEEIIDGFCEEQPCIYDDEPIDDCPF